MVHTERETVGVVCGENSDAVLSNLFVERDNKCISISVALEDLESCTNQPYPIDMTRESFQFIGEALNEIGQKAVIRFKEKAKEQGKEWEGTLEFACEPDPLEEPEVPKQISEVVDIESDMIKITSKSIYDLDRVDGESRITLVLFMTPDGETLTGIDWEEVTEIEQGLGIQTGIIKVRLSGNRVYSVETKEYPDDLTAPKKGSISSHKLFLP